MGINICSVARRIGPLTLQRLPFLPPPTPTHSNQTFLSFLRALHQPACLPAASPCYSSSFMPPGQACTCSSLPSQTFSNPPSLTFPLSSRQPWDEIMGDLWSGWGCGRLQARLDVSRLCFSFHLSAFFVSAAPEPLRAGGLRTTGLTTHDKHMMWRS